MRLLAGDIGGTNARLVLYETSDDTDFLDVELLSTYKIISQMYYKNHDFPSFTEVLLSFTSLPSISNIKIHTCCLAVAGPVTDNQINFTNREGWILDGNAIRTDFDIDHVLLINDFVANGYGLLALTEKELTVLNQGKYSSRPGKAKGPVALVGAGTGLGQCYLTPDGSGFRTAFATEGGHVEFTPRTALEEELFHYLQRRLATVHSADDVNTDNSSTHSHEELRPRVSVERLVSGQGLENIYEFLREKYSDQVSPDFDENYNESNERGRLIGSQKYNYGLFQRALEIMFAIYGNHVGNVALQYCPLGGLYIAGGIAPKNIEFITKPGSEFMHRYLSKGRMTSIMRDFPLYVVMTEDLGLRGAHIMAARLAATMKSETNTAKSVPSKDGAPNGLHTTQNVYRNSIADNLREAVSNYPVTFAVATSLSAACTAAAISVGLAVAIGSAATRYRLTKN